LNKTYDASVYIGRFQPFLNAHLSQLRQALALAPLCMVVIAGAHRATSPRHPFTGEQRAAMILAALSPQERSRVRIICLRDDYDTLRWSAQVQAQLAAFAPEAGAVALLQEPNSHLPSLPWAHISPEKAPSASSSAWRERMYAAPDAGAELASGHALLAPGTEGLLADWLSGPDFKTAAANWEALQQMRAEWAGSPYTPIFVTVDAVVHCAGQILLIQRGRAPGEGLLALPGGFIEADETVTQSAIRELIEETGLDVPLPELHAALREIRVFDDPWRSQRGRVLTHGHYFDLGERKLPAICAGDDAANAFWVPRQALPDLEARFHDDHYQILDYFLHLIGPGDTACACAQ